MNAPLRFIVAFAMLLSGCAPMVRSPALSENASTETKGAANSSFAATAAPETTSAGGLQYRMLRYRDELGQIGDDAMARAVRERFALIEPELKRAGITRDNWTSLGPANKYGGRVNALYVDSANPQHLLAGGATGGIWQTNDAGAHWAPVNDFLASLSISSFAGDAGNPATIYAATSEYYYTGTQGVGVLKSTDGGNSWQLLSSTDPSASNVWTYVMRLAAHPTSPGVLIAGTWSAAVRSADGGNTWSRVFTQTGFDGHATTVFDVQYNPSDPNQVLLGLQDSAVAYSSDGGLTWTKVQIAPPANERSSLRLAFARSVPGLVYASVNRNGGEVWRSSDAGHSWTFASNPGHTLGSNAVNAIWVDPTNAQRLIVGGQDVWRSPDGGSTFERISDWTQWPSSNHADQHAMVADPAYDGVNVTRVYFAGDGGVYRADSVASTSLVSGWTNLNNGLNAVQFWGATASPAAGGLFVGGTQDHGTLVFQRLASNWFEWFRGDGGMTWIDPTDPLTFYGEYTFAAVFRTVDGGASNGHYICTGITEAYKVKAISPTFAPCGLGTTGETNFIAPTVLDPNQPGRLWLGAKSLWVTEDAKDGAPQWSTVKPPSNGTTANGDGNWISAIALQPGNSNSVWVGHNNGEIYLSSNALAATPTWTPISGLPARMVTRIILLPSYGRIYITHGGFTHGNLHVSYDGAVTWQDVSGALPAAPIYSLAVGRQNPDFLYAGTQVGLFTSEDGGQTWSASNDAPANVPIEELSWLDDTTLIAATHGRGAFLASTVIPAAVEYYYAAWNFYFETAFPDEVAALDGGAFGGLWKRTGQTFKVWSQPTGSASPTCRFFSTSFAPKSSHFYTPFPAECEIVKANPGWQFESIAFYVQLADANGLCPPGTIPLYRLYNNGMGGAPNHRYTTSLTIFNQMVAAGWVFEGNGNTKVFACVPK